VQRAQAATEWIEFVDSKKYLINFFLTIQSDVRFKNRLMHHDCKLTNILFDKTTHRAICPVDLDTTMPGYFFSDLGDMIRSMVPSQPENSLAWSELVVQPTIYSSIVKGYTEGVKDAFSEEEQHHLHSSGLLMLFMQGVRFLTDYLLADRYYKTRYENQNLDRAKNQFIIFQQLEKFVFDSFGYQIK
jgi:Ser/Thr protein kinase RdoA (MazF antagonist)